MFEIHELERPVVTAPQPRCRYVEPRLRSRIEPLDADYLPAIEQFLLRTDRESRLGRFGSIASDAVVVTHARSTVTQATLLLGAFVDLTLRGLLEVYDCGGRRMEIALIVDPAWRCRGFATALLHAAIASGPSIEAGSYRLMFSASNWPMRRIAQKANARLDLSSGEIEAEIDLSGSRERNPSNRSRTARPPHAIGGLANALPDQAFLRDVLLAVRD